jgi:hypothetical protein
VCIIGYREFMVDHKKPCSGQGFFDDRARQVS